MKYLPKNAQELKDKELAEYLFPKKALEQVKAEASKPSPKPPKRS